MRIASAGPAVFAALMIGLGIQGLTTGEFTAVWQPVPKGVPAREVLAYLCALLSLASGIGLLWRRTAGLAARVLLGSLVLWLLVWRVRAVFFASLLEGSWSFAETMVMASGTWVLFAWFATDWGRQHLGFATGEKGVRIARVFYGLGLIPFGYAHFANLKGTSAPRHPRNRGSGAGTQGEGRDNGRACRTADSDVGRSRRTPGPEARSVRV